MGRKDLIQFRWTHIALIILLAESCAVQARNLPPVLQPLVDVPARAVWVDLAGDGADSGRATSGSPVFTRASLETLPFAQGRIRIDSTAHTLELTEPLSELVIQVDIERADAVIEMVALRGEHPIGSLLFGFDGSKRQGLFDAVDGRIGMRTRESFDRVELRTAHAPAGATGFTIESAWAGSGSASRANRGGTGNDFATFCQVPLGIAHNVAFGASLVPGAGVLAQGTAYATNLALKWCLTFIEPPPDRVIRVPAGVCEATFEQPHMVSTYENALGVSLGYNSNWGELGSPTVFHHNTEVDVVLLYNTSTPAIAPSLDLGFWAETGSFEATDRIYEDCRADGSVRFSQLDGTGPMYECPYVEGRELSFPVGERLLRWRVNARMSALDLFAPLIPGIPPGAKGQPWKGLLINAIREAILIANDAVFFSGWRIDNHRDVFQLIRVYDEIPPSITPQPFSDDRITAVLVGAPPNQTIEVTIEADEAGGVSRLRFEPLLRSMYALADACGRNVSFSASYPQEALRSFWPVSTSGQPNAFDITWTARDPGPNLALQQNEVSTTMRVEVVDTRPPVIVPPDDIVEVDSGAVSALGQPLVFDFVDLNPIVSNDAVLPIGLGLTLVNWTVTDASGNSDSAVQIVNVKASNLPPSPIAQTGANRVDAVSFEPTPIRLQATDPDGDPLRFFIDQAPADGFFIAPLYPYFVEDFRVEQSLTDAQVLAICTNGQGSDRNFHLDFPSEPRHLSSTDDGRTYVVDRGYIDCRGGAPVSFEREGRIAVFGNDGAYIDGVPVNDNELRDVVLDVNQGRLFLTSHASGGQSSLRVYDLDLNLQVSYRLANLRDRDGNPVSLLQPGGGSTLDDANSGGVDANGLLYVMSRYSVIHVLDGTLPPGFDCSVNCTHTPAYIGALNDDGLAFEGSGRELQLDADGRIVAGRRSRLYRYTPSYIAADGLAYPGTLEGWLGRCDIDLAVGDQAVCDVGNRRTLGFSCTDATCAVDEAFNPEEQVICGASGIGGQPTWGCRPGQFRGVPALDIDPRGTIYVADSGNARIQRYSTDGFFAGQAESTCDGSCFVLGDFGNPQNVTVNSSRFFVLDPATNLLHISLLTPFVEIGPDYADLEYQSNNDFACVNPADCIDGFSFQISDGVRDPVTGRTIRSAPAGVEIGVVRNFRPPFATPGIAVVLDEDTPNAITLDGSDPDPLDSLVFNVVDPPANGTLSIVANQATYTPDPDFFGEDEFTFIADDGVFASAPEDVRVTVAEVNDPAEVRVPEPATVGVGFVYRMNAEFVDPDPDEQHRLRIDWGDGTVEFETATDGGGPEVGQSGNGVGTLTAEHIYSAPGTYIVELCLDDRVVGDDGSETPTSETLTGCNSFPVTAIDGLDLVMSAVPSTERALPNQLISILFRALNAPPTAGPPTTATGVELNVDLPEGLAPGSITVSGTGCVLNGLQVSCDVGTLNPGFSGSVEITAQVDGLAAPGTLLAFTARASANQTDVNPDNEVSHVISVVPPADIYVDALADAFLDKSDTDPGDGLCRSEDGVCTLRAAIEEANAQPGLRVVSIGTGVYTLDPGTDIQVTDDLVLIGTGAANSIIDGSDGGTALSVGDVDVTLRIENLTVSRGRVRAWPGDLVVRRSRFTGGVADGFVGGAIIANNGIDIRDTVFDNNRAVSGGAIWAQASSSGIFENVTVTGNQGGGLYLGGSDYTLNHVTITGNSGDTGGASGVSGGALTVRNGAQVTITGSVLAGNYRPPGPPVLLDVPINCAVEAPGQLISGGDNLFGDLTGCGLTPTAADIVIADRDAELQPIRFAGSSLPFIAPFANSPVVDAMLGPDCPPVDAIGTVRPVDGNNDGFADCDIGAIELVPDLAPPELNVSTTAIDFGEVAPGASSSTRTVTLSNIGEQDLTIDVIVVRGPAAADYSLPATNNSCGGATLAAGQSCGFELVFTPQQSGVRNASVEIRSSNPGGPRVIELTGTSGVLFFDGFED
ncbi:MAG: choice-of-anchor D domain-containing protein [Gammaproteobacteria bacterium]|nr:choice-of-anchor D domain-containing protein [Gammaproteobacteria bacterium]